jgi:hypothetical protein
VGSFVVFYACQSVVLFYGLSLCEVGCSSKMNFLFVCYNRIILVRRL